MQCPSNHDVAVFWDFENCHPSSSIPGHAVVDSIRTVAHNFGSIKLFKAYLELSEQAPSTKSMTFRSELQSSGVSLTDCPHTGRKNVADQMIIVDMMTYVMDHPSPATIVLISGDRDFAYALSVLRLRRYRVIVISSPAIGTTSALRTSATIYLDWNIDVMGRPVNISPNLSKAGRDVHSWTSTGLVASPENYYSCLEEKHTSRPSLYHERNTIPLGTGTYQYSSQSDFCPAVNQRTQLPPNDYFSVPYSQQRSSSANSSGAAFAPTEYQNRTKSPVIQEASDKVSRPSSTVGRTVSIGTPGNATTGDDCQASFTQTSGDIPNAAVSNTPAATQPYSEPIINPPMERPSSSSSSVTAAVTPPSANATNTTMPSNSGGQGYTNAQTGPSRETPKRVPPEFKVLVDVLEMHLKKGRIRPMRSIVACELVTTDKNVYSRAGVISFSRYVGLAERSGIVQTGFTDTKEPWIALLPEWQGVSNST